MGSNLDPDPSPFTRSDSGDLKKQHPLNKMSAADPRLMVSSQPGASCKAFSFMKYQPSRNFLADSNDAAYQNNIEHLKSGGDDGI